MSEEMESLPEPQIATRLVAAAVSRANSHGRRLGDGADYFIRERADYSAGLIKQNRANMDDVIRTFERLIDEMVRAVDEIPGYADEHPNVIGERTLSLALSRLCPLFPIC